MSEAACPKCGEEYWPYRPELHRCQSSSLGQRGERILPDASTAVATTGITPEEREVVEAAMAWIDARSHWADAVMDRTTPPWTKHEAGVRSSLLHERQAQLDEACAALRRKREGK